MYAFLGGVASKNINFLRTYPLIFSKYGQKIDFFRFNGKNGLTKCINRFLPLTALINSSELKSLPDIKWFEMAPR